MDKVACCHGPDWKPLWDLGEAGSFDFLLGRCATCGEYLMHIWRMGDEEYLPVTADDADRLLQAEPGSERKRSLLE